MSPEEYSAGGLDDLPRAKIMRGLWLSVLAGAFGGAFYQLTIGVIFVGFALALGASNRQIGFLTSTMALGSLAQLFGSYLIQRTGRRRRLFVTTFLISRSLWVLIILVPLVIPEELANWRIPMVFAILLASNVLHALGANAWMSWRTSASRSGRPVFFLDFHRQYSLNPRPCHRTTVSGLTTIRHERQPCQSRDSQTQKTRSRRRRRGRLTDRCSTVSWWRRARFSAANAARLATRARRRATNSFKTATTSPRSGWKRRS